MEEGVERGRADAVVAANFRDGGFGDFKVALRRELAPALMALKSGEWANKEWDSLGKVHLRRKEVALFI